MSQFFIESETEKVEFLDGQWVEIKQELDQEDQDAIAGAMLKLKGKDIEMQVGRLILLERMVVAWSFDAPVNKSTLSKLRRKYREPVLEKINDLNSAAFEYVAKN
jgi:hypothetical protein